ncbi:MAG TPA: hypothetical protein VK629_01685 [Steroidobacteraceae bacterium]|nr:hypothetical protein [Steroidobacteraceae bacterium]
MKGQPDPSDMLEELADKAITHIGRLAVTSFESALSEMVDFHQFLIDAYATKDDAGKPVSFAQIGDWHALHRDWNRQYRRLFERAVENIGRENDFVDVLVHLPLRLLPGDARNAAPEVVTGLLDLPNIFVHRLERWLTNRRVYEAVDAGQPPVARLAGTDKRAYEEVLVGFVGAWESLLQTVSHLYSWSKKEVAPEEQWRRYTASAPFLQQHLRNSAYLLAVAVWNEDEIGAKYYRETLLRWLEGLRHEFDENDHYPRRLLTPDILEADWNGAQAALARAAEHPEWDRPGPTAVFTAILQNQLSDVITVTCGVILAWRIEGRQATDIAARTASVLLKDIVDEEGGHRVGRQTGFQQLMLGICRIWTSSERFERKGYGYWLDGLVSLLDSMTERRVVPGRVYSPSTRNERDDLRLPWLACLLASLPEEGDDGAVESIGKLAQKEEALAHGDESLRGLIHELQQSKAALESPDNDYLKRGAQALDKDQDVEARVVRLLAILAAMIDGIAKRRAERLRDRRVNPAKLDHVRKRVEAAILSGNGGIDVFRDFTIERDGADLATHEVHASQVQKGYLTDPLMAREPVNLWDVTVRSVQNRAASYVWQDFVRRPRRIIETRDEESYRTTLFDEAKRLLAMGHQPVLLVHRGHEPSWVREWFRWGEQRAEGIDVVRKTGMKGNWNSYAGTVNDVDVYRLETDPGKSLLFRADLLRRVKYGSDDQGRVVEIEFDDDRDRGLVFRFTQGTEWWADEVLEIAYPVAPPE